MSVINDHGQPVGDPVDWSPRPPIEPTELAGQHVRLVPLRIEHAEGLFEEMRQSPENFTYTPYDPPADLDGMRELVRGQLTDPSLVPHAIEVDGRVVGTASFMRVDPANGSAEVGYILMGPSLQRTTASSEAIYLMTRHVFDTLGYRRWEWKCDSLNEPSRRAATRFGFSHEGRFRQILVYKGRNRDTDWFALIDRDWPAVRAAFEAWLAPENFDDQGRQLSRLDVAKMRDADPGN